MVAAEESCGKETLNNTINAIGRSENAAIVRHSGITRLLLEMWCVQMTIRQRGAQRRLLWTDRGMSDGC